MALFKIWLDFSGMTSSMEKKTIPLNAIGVGIGPVNVTQKQQLRISL